MATENKKDPADTWRWGGGDILLQTQSSKQLFSESEY